MKRTEEDYPVKIKARHIHTDNKKKTANKQRWVKREGK